MSCSAESSTCFSRRPEITACASMVSVDVYAQQDAHEAFCVWILPITCGCLDQSNAAGYSLTGTFSCPSRPEGVTPGMESNAPRRFARAAFSARFSASVRFPAYFSTVSLNSDAE